MNNVLGFRDVDRLIVNLFQLRQGTNSFDREIIEGFIDYINGHLNQINGELGIIRDYLNLIESQQADDEANM